MQEKGLLVRNIFARILFVLVGQSLIESDIDRIKALFDSNRIPLPVPACGWYTLMNAYLILPCLEIWFVSFHANSKHQLSDIYSKNTDDNHKTNFHQFQSMIYLSKANEKKYRKIRTRFLEITVALKPSLISTALYDRPLYSISMLLTARATNCDD